MPTKDQVLRLVQRGRSFQQIGDELGLPAGQAYLIGTGIPADGSDTLTHHQRQRPGVLPSHAQRLVNDRECNPVSRDEVRDWMRRRAEADLGMRLSGESRS